MVNPWDGPRHHSWASNTILTAIAAGVLLITTIIVDATNGPADPPTYLTGLLGMAGGALFGAAGSDKAKREREIAHDAKTARSRMRDVNETAIRAEAKADAVASAVAAEHPEVAEQMPPPLIENDEKGES